MTNTVKRGRGRPPKVRPEAQDTGLDTLPIQANPHPIRWPTPPLPPRTVTLDVVPPPNFPAPDSLTEPRPNPVVTVPAPRPEPHRWSPPVPAPAPTAEPLPNQGRLVEIEILHKYAPMGQEQEIKATVPPGTVMSLPVQEAQRALQLGIARATNNTFRI